MHQGTRRQLHPRHPAVHVRKEATDHAGQRGTGTEPTSLLSASLKVRLECPVISQTKRF